MSRSPRGARPDSPEIAGLRELAVAQPALAAAAHLQIDLLGVIRRVQRRVSTPALAITADAAAARLAAGQRLVDFDDILIDWTEARLLVRQVTDILRRFDFLDAAQAEALYTAGRAPGLPDMARRWYDNGKAAEDDVPPPMLFGEAIGWALRPFLRRVADMVQPFIDPAVWRRGTCPVCGGEPDLSLVGAGGERLLHCGRCQTRWSFDPVACPFCGEADHAALTSFATPDGPYRVLACRTCGRYVKALDGRKAGRGLLPALDATATLPLDAVILQKGFR